MNTSLPTQLFNAQTANGQSGGFFSFGSFVTLIAQGTWGGASLVVQVSPDKGINWIDTEVTLSANGVKNFIGGSGLRYRLDLRSVGTTSINAWVAHQE